MTDDRWRVELGDCLAVLERLPAESIDAVVTDPPYGLEFMGAEWDRPATSPRDFQAWCEAWARACWRALKPGGFLLAFGGTRTAHRLACGIEDAGFEIRDRVLTLNGHVLGAELAWVYGSGWPKSRNIGKAIDARAGAVREVVGTKIGQPGYSLAESKGGAVYGEGIGGTGDPEREAEITAPATPEAAQWEGWGTALKPAHEPIVVARKPFRGTVEEQVLATGTGAINVNACRIRMRDGEQLRHDGSDPERRRGVVGRELQPPGDRNAEAQRESIERANQLGRWPANVALVHAAGCERVGAHVLRGDQRAGTDTVGAGRSWLKPSGSQPAGPVVGDEVVEDWACEPGCPVALLDRMSGDVGASAQVLGHEPSRLNGTRGNAYGAAAGAEGRAMPFYGDAGGASRFYYSGKAGPRERDAGLEGLDAPPPEERAYPRPNGWTPPPTVNVHPTVKPIDLMRWLVRLVAPQGAVVLDPFAGSGSTGCAAALEGVRFVGIERDETFASIARARIAFWAGFPVGTPVARVLAKEEARQQRAEEAHEQRRAARAAGQLDLLAGDEEQHG